MFRRKFIFCDKLSCKNLLSGNLLSDNRGLAERDSIAGGQSEQEGSIRVTAEDLYSPQKGYGFVTEENRRRQELLQIPELNSGFVPVYWYQDRVLSELKEDISGCYLDSDESIAGLEEMTGEIMEGEHRRIPLSFKADVPHQGNYRVTVTVCGKETMRDVLIFTGRRRLGFRGDICAGGAVFTHTMTVNVCDIIPRGHTEAYTDKSLDITVVADRPGLSAVVIEEADCPTVYIAGDSTVTDQSAEYPYAPGTSYSGWGQMLSGYFNTNLAVSNHAHSGLTTDSFREEGHCAIVEQYSRPGDFLFIQFGHNDQKLDELRAEGGYRDNLIRYIGECRERGIFPVLVTPLARNTWKGNDGAYNDLLAAYADSCIRVGEEEKVPVVDLHGLSMKFVVNNGLEASKPYFFPNDYTHSNDYGAYYMAGLVAGEIVRVCGSRGEEAYRFLAQSVTEGYGAWRPAERIVPPVKPKMFEDVLNPKDAGELLGDIDRLSEAADRVSVLDMLIRTVKFFPTNVYNDMFTDVMGHEWYAGIVECAYQNGMIDGGLTEGGEFCPLKPVTLEEFLVFAINAYKSRRTLPARCTEEECAYDGKCREFARAHIRAACALGWIAKDASEDLKRVITRGEAVAFCRNICAR